MRASTIIMSNRSLPTWPSSLFAWTKEQEQRYSVGLLKYLNGWAKLQEFPGRMVDWDLEAGAVQGVKAADGVGPGVRHWWFLSSVVRS